MGLAEGSHEPLIRRILCMIAICTTCAFLFSAVIANFRLRIFSKKPSPLGVLILLAIFIQIVPGIVLVSFFDFPMSYGLHSLITDEVLYFTYWYTLGSLALLLFLLVVASYFVCLDVDLNSWVASKRMAYLLYFVSFLLIMVKIISVGDVPFVQAVMGSPDSAAEQKARILKGEVGAGGFLVGYLFAYFHYIALLYIYISRQQRLVGRLFYFTFLMFVAIYSIYDLQKYNFAFFAIFLGVIHSVYYGITLRKLLIFALCSLVLLVGAFFILHDASFDDVLVQVASRAFIGQMEGSYMIYQALSPNIERIYYGLPLSFFFGDFGITDPSADVVKIFFPTAGDAWVNSNTYVLAHAWSIFGFSAIFLMPLIVVLNVVVLAVLRDALKSYVGLLAVCTYFVVLLMLRINNDFSYFLYMKCILSYVVLLLFSLLLSVVVNGGLRRRSKFNPS